jgi:epoxyqueuosine reductase
LESGMAATMQYMYRQESRRTHPHTIVAGTSRALVVTRNYFAPDPPTRPAAGRVARYARGQDYHRSLRRPLEELAAFVRSLGNTGTIARPYVDAGPVPERELAQRAGLGWIGKNTMLIDPRRGSFTFLATVLTNLELAVDGEFGADRCGSCRRCLDACPTNAFPGERVLDARRCISYLTIEHKGDDITDDPKSVSQWIFGCDVCQDVCPWNHKFARETEGVELELDQSMAWLDLERMAEINEGEFRRSFARTALERPGTTGMRRNARAAMRYLTEKEEGCRTSSKQ